MSRVCEEYDCRPMLTSCDLKACRLDVTVDLLYRAWLTTVRIKWTFKINAKASQAGVIVSKAYWKSAALL